MSRAISIGAQGFADIREKDCFFVDKTKFIRSWWRSGDVATLVCRPRRFGKTLSLSMVECFFSQRYANRSDLFEGLAVWDDGDMRGEQGAWPVISVSFADAKSPTFDGMRALFREIISEAYRLQREWLQALSAPEDRAYAERMMQGKIGDADIALGLKRLSEMLCGLSGKKVIVLVDEYDTPLQEAWLSGYWDQARDMMRGLLNSTFKTNPYLERGLLTGIARVAHESIFSDLNNLKVVSSTSDEYASAFGFTQDEVDSSLAEYGLAASRDAVKSWYDGFTFGSVENIYNPWSITNFLDTGKLAPYWSNTSGNELVSYLVSRGDADFKGDFELLLSGETVTETVSEQIVFPDLEFDSAAVWSLLATSGYLRISALPASGRSADGNGGDLFGLAITNYETRLSFDAMVKRWFARARGPYNKFVQSLLVGDVEAMNAYMNEVALDTFSVFDTGTRPSESEPERFYHGFVLGLLVDLRGRYLVRSNRESGFGRYDVMLVPVDAQRDYGIVIEFKVFDSKRETSLEDTVAGALEQIERKGYAAELLAGGVPHDHIRTYGFAFEGKRVLIG